MIWRKIMFIGFFSIANVVTLFGLISSLTACFLAANENFIFAIYMLFLACICDIFDGKIARLDKERSSANKFYGIQLDSLCDMVSFGVAPCFIAFSAGYNGVIDVIIYCIFVICGATRLAYFNTLANAYPKKAKKSFKGIPIPVSTLLITFLFMLREFNIPFGFMQWIFRIFLLALAVGYILNIRIKKPDMKQGMILMSIEIIMLLILLIASFANKENVDPAVEKNAEVSTSSEVTE